MTASPFVRSIGRFVIFVVVVIVLAGTAGAATSLAISKFQLDIERDTAVMVVGASVGVLCYGCKKFLDKRADESNTPPA